MKTGHPPAPQPTRQPEPAATPPTRRFAVYDDRELITIITATSFYPPAPQVGPAGTAPGNLIFHDHTGTPTAVFASGTWTHTEPTAKPIPDAPPPDMHHTT